MLICSAVHTYCTQTLTHTQYHSSVLLSLMFWMILQAVDELSNRTTLVTDPVHSIKKRKSVWRENVFLICLVLGSRGLDLWWKFESYLSSTPLFLRMVWTSAAVAGPCSFWPFNISFSSSSRDWNTENRRITVCVYTEKTGLLYLLFSYFVLLCMLFDLFCTLHIVLAVQMYPFCPANKSCSTENGI